LKKESRQAAPLDAIFSALAEETRLQLVGLLARQDLCVCDLVDSLADPQPKISRHLAYLRRAGIVTGERHLAAKAAPLAMGLIGFICRTAAHGGRTIRRVSAIRLTSPREDEQPRPDTPRETTMRQKMMFCSGTASPNRAIDGTPHSRGDSVGVFVGVPGHEPDRTTHWNDRSGPPQYVSDRRRRATSSACEAPGSPPPARRSHPRLSHRCIRRS
jgi:hypothetical protein